MIGKDLVHCTDCDEEIERSSAVLCSFCHLPLCKPCGKTAENEQPLCSLCNEKLETDVESSEDEELNDIEIDDEDDIKPAELDNE